MKTMLKTTAAMTKAMRPATRAEGTAHLSVVTVAGKCSSTVVEVSAREGIYAATGAPFVGVTWRRSVM